MREWVRLLIGAVIIGATTSGGALLTAIQGQADAPTRAQLFVAGLTGGLALLSEVKARLTPPPGT